jgi:hypothetical protein
MRPDKYRPLHLFLAQLPPDVVEVQLCMAELETLLGARLPVSAYWPDYWHSAGQLARRHWLPLGFSARLRRRETVVTFTRRTKPKRSAATVERLVLSATRLGRGSHRGFVEALSQRYRPGASVLFPASAELLAVASDAVEESVALFNDAIAAPLDRYPAASEAGTVTVAVDPGAIPAGCAATVAVSVRGSVALAKADALDDMGERRGAHELIQQTLRPPPGSAGYGGALRRHHLRIGRPQQHDCKRVPLRLQQYAHDQAIVYRCRKNSLRATVSELICAEAR